MADHAGKILEKRMGKDRDFKSVKVMLTKAKCKEGQKWKIFH